MTPLERAEGAKQLLENPVFRDVIGELEKRLIARAVDSAIGDTQTHHEVVLSLQLLRQIPRNIEAFAQELVIDKHRIKHQKFIKTMKETV